MSRTIHRRCRITQGGVMNNARFNVVARPDLDADTLGGHVVDIMGTSQDPQWRTKARELTEHLVRFAEAC